MNKWLLIIAPTIILCGCVSSPPASELSPTTVEVTQYVAYECGTPPSVSPLRLLDIEWQVLPDAEGEYRFTLTPDGYENLGKNVADILERAKQQRALIDFYSACIAESKESDFTNASE